MFKKSKKRDGVDLLRKFCSLVEIGARVKSWKIL